MDRQLMIFCQNELIQLRRLPRHAKFLPMPALEDLTSKLYRLLPSFHKCLIASYVQLQRPRWRHAVTYSLIIQ